jgi:predicted GIY-YIG superfamily endonuclease
MPSYLYVLRSAATGRYMIGSTNDLKRKLDDHNNNDVRGPQRVEPWECVYVEVCDNLDAARQRERYLKSVDGVAEKIRILYTTPESTRPQEGE